MSSPTTPESKLDLLSQQLSKLFEVVGALGDRMSKYEGVLTPTVEVQPEDPEVVAKREKEDEESLINDYRRFQSEQKAIGRLGGLPEFAKTYQKEERPQISHSYFRRTLEFGGDASSPSAKLPMNIRQSLAREIEAEEILRKKNVRERAAKFKDALQIAETSASSITYHAKAPSITFQLKTTDVHDVNRFIKSVTEYITKYRILVTAGTYVDTEVLGKVCAEANKYTEHKDRLTVPEFITMPNEELFAHLLAYVEPRDNNAFLRALNSDKSATFDWESSKLVSVFNFDKFFEALQVYQKDFIHMYELLADRLKYRKGRVPPVTNKEGGLIHAFLSKIPHGYGKAVHLELNTQEKEKSNDYTIITYVSSFMIFANNDREIATYAVSVLRRFSGTRYEAVRKNPDGRLLNIEPVHIETEEVPEVKIVPAVELSRECDEFYFDDVYDEGPALADQSFHALQYSSVPAKTNPGPCYRKVRTGFCPDEKKGCKFAHDDKTLLPLMVEQQTELSKRIARMKSGQPIPAQSSAPASTAPQILRRPNGLHASSSLETREEEATHLVTDSARNFLAIHEPLAELVSAVHTQGVVKLGVTALKLNKTLMDTGASHDNFLSLSWVRAHLNLLQGILKEEESSIRLGADDIVIPIKYSVILSVSFPDSSGQLHSASLKFRVIETSAYDMVIGFPTLVRELYPLLLDMLARARSAVSDVHSLSDSSPDLVSLSPDATLANPWSISPRDLAPEDEICPPPCSFSEPLAHMAKTYEEALQEFTDLIESRVAPEMMRDTAIRNLLMTKAISVFIARNWDGINDVEVELTFKDSMPAEIRQHARPVNPRLVENAYAEFQRLFGYFYEPSYSPISSCLVIAPKATKPFIRLAGDYRKINPHIEWGNVPIPHVQHRIEDIIQYTHFIDLDMTNGFHQIRIGPKTRAALSLHTPWGHVQPKFLPEGISPASGILQTVVAGIFAKYDFIIVIFDNILVLCRGVQDAYEKFELVLDVCIKSNLKLKFAKSKLGFTDVEFFGYLCRSQSYELTDERKQSILNFPRPSTLKQMQSFMGSAQFFNSFVPHFSTIAEPLYAMTHKTFQWHKNTWTPALLAHFDAFKSALADSVKKHYPDYSLPWVLRTDASTVGVGAVLLQIRNGIEEIITFVSEKFSDPATRWSTIEQEAYALFVGVKKNEFYLRCKDFLLEMDHANLLWLWLSMVPKIIRWRLFLQSFSFTLKHIPGKTNVLADFLSRAFTAVTPAEDSSLSHISSVEEEGGESVSISPRIMTVEQMFDEVHGKLARRHPGRRLTWIAFNKRFPGHRIPFDVIAELVADCPVCQKERLKMENILVPISRPLHDARREAVGVDTLTVTPPDRLGNCYVFVVVVHSTKLTYLHPAKENTALCAAEALISFFATYGVYSLLVSDPGSEYENEIISHLTSWLGVYHQFSLVDRHQSNGVERTNGRVLQHLRTLVADERVKHCWSEPAVLRLVQLVLNSVKNAETGFSPFELHFGQEAQHMRLPVSDSSPDKFGEYIKCLDQALTALWERSRLIHSDVTAKRQTVKHPALQNQFQAGDLILFDNWQGGMRSSKLSPKLRGPYEVIKQINNDVTCKHCNDGTVQILHVDRVILFTGSKEDARQLAKLDNDQFEIRAIKHWRGRPEIRTTMEFLVEFEDSDVKWLPFSRDLWQSAPFEAYCRAVPELFPLIFTAEEAKKQIAAINKTKIPCKPGDTFFLDLFYFGWTWFRAMQFPDRYTKRYVLQYKCGKLTDKTQRKMEVKDVLTGETRVEDSYFFRAYAHTTAFDKRTMILVDKAFARLHPVVLGEQASEILSKWAREDDE